MSTDGDMYHHTQKGPWGLLCYALAAAFLVAALYLPVLALQITFLVTGLFLLLLGASLGHLTVEDDEDQLTVRFGPFPLFRRRILFDDILEVGPTMRGMNPKTALLTVKAQKTNKPRRQDTPTVIETPGANSDDAARLIRLLRLY